MLRDFLDSILSFIDSESLTDQEFDSLPESLTEEYTRETYFALKGVLENREGVSGQAKKLESYFIAKGVDLSGSSARTPISQIFIGSKL